MARYGPVLGAVLVMSAVVTVLPPWCGRSWAAGTTLYVSPAGNDEWSGRVESPNAAGTDGPLSSLQRARDVLRELRAAGQLTPPATVVLRSGIYFLPTTLELGPEDSGTEASPVVFRSYPGEMAWLSGGRPLRDWALVPGAQPVAWTTRIPEVAGGSWYFRQLFVKRAGETWFTRRFRPMTPMRVVADTTWSPARKSMPHRAAQPDFVFFPGDLQPWRNLEDVEVVALHSWSASLLYIENLDLERRIVRFTSVPTFRIGHWYKDGRNPYYVENVAELLQEPGQWYLNRPSGELIYLPLEGEKLDQVMVVAPRLERLVALTGDLQEPRFVEHITFERIGFMHTEWPLPREGYDTSQGQPALSAAVEVTGGRDIRFEGCVVAHTGAYAIGLGPGSQQCAVVGCLMFDLGGGGVKVGSQGLSRHATFPLLPTGNVVENNTITDVGVVHYSANGIWCGVVKDTRIAHNEVCRCPYTGIAVGWCWDDKPSSCAGNIIEHNHVHHVMELVQDGGGIYTLGRQPGTIIRGNLIHDNQPSPFACAPGQAGLYFDQGSSGFLVEENIQYNVAWVPERIHQNQPGEMDIRTNYLNVSPGDPGFPHNIAAQAGVQEQYRWPDADRIPLTRNPVYGMTLPDVPPPPVSFALDFEDIPVGQFPKRFGCNGASETATIVVTDEVACGGQRSLKFQDRKGLAKVFYPYLSRMDWQIERGRVELAFDVMQSPDAPARLWVELRDYATAPKGQYLAGPSLGLLADGTVTLPGDKPLGVLPLGQWGHIAMRFSLGEAQAGEWEAALTLPDGTVHAVRAPFARPDFEILTGLIMSAAADADGMVYVDNLALTVEE